MISGAEATFSVRGCDDAAVAAAASRFGVSLAVGELRAIAERLDRDPTLVEAHAFAAQWSEHCSYKSSRALLSRLPTVAPDVILGPREDAGIVRLGRWNGESYGIVIAHESHNHPSQVVPFEGAATGIGGIVRDVLCMGAEVIGVADPLRFGPLAQPHCRYVAQSVVDGIAAYGNAIGVPNVGGDVYVHDGFRDNCLVNVVALGLVKESEVIHSAAPPGSEGWDIVLVGKATDRSGFGGAAFSSLVLDEDDAQANKGAVQVPDPFLKSVIMRASYRAFAEIRARGLDVGFKDLGAGGIMGCTAELVGSGGFGATIDLERCPTSQPNLPPEVIAVGETQERLAWVVPPAFTPVLLAIYNDEFALPNVARGACAAVIGRVEATPDYVLRYRGDEVMRVPVDFLTGGIRYERVCELPVPERRAPDAPPAIERALLDLDLAATLEGLLAHRDICSRAPIYERYDGVVRGVTAHPPGRSDAGILVPVTGAPLALALSVDGNPRFGALDAERAAEHAVYESVRNVVAVGARPIGLTDCLNFGNPEDPQQMGELVAAIDGLATAARAFGLAFVSGNVSLYNTSASGRSVPASPIVACIGVLDDVARAASPAFARTGAPLYYVGAREHALGGSAVAELAAIDDRTVPAIAFERAARECAFVRQAIGARFVGGVHDVADGGLAVALCEMAFATRGHARIGAHVRATSTWDPQGHPAFALFGEAGGFVLEAADDASLQALARSCDVELHAIGTTTAAFSFVADDFAAPGNLDLDRCYATWRDGLAGFYENA